MPVRTGVILAAKDFFDQPITLSDATLMLGRMNRSSVLRSCAQLSALNETVVRFNGGWHSKGSRSLIPEFARLIFPTSPPGFQKLVQEICYLPNFTAAFLDFAIAGLMGLACRYCPPEKGQDLTRDLRRRENLTRILLQLQQDAFPSEELLAALDTGRFENVFAKSTRSIMATASTQNEWFKDLGRLHLLTSIPEIGKALAAKSGYKDAIDWFQARLGISVHDYEALSHIFLAYASTDSLNHAPMFRDFISSSHFGGRGSVGVGEGVIALWGGEREPAMVCPVLVDRI